MSTCDRAKAARWIDDVHCSGSYAGKPVFVLCFLDLHRPVHHFTRPSPGDVGGFCRYQRTPAAPQSELWTRKGRFALGAENIAEEVCDPLAPARGDIEIAYRR